MDRALLIASTLCYLTTVVCTLATVSDRIALHARFNFLAVGALEPLAAELLERIKGG
jgi:hypothetical protein